MSHLLTLPLSGARVGQAAHHYAHLSPSALHCTPLYSNTYCLPPLYLSIPQFDPHVSINVVMFPLSRCCPCFVSCLSFSKYSLPVLASRLPASVLTHRILTSNTYMYLCKHSSPSQVPNTVAPPRIHDQNSNSNHCRWCLPRVASLSPTSIPLDTRPWPLWVTLKERNKKGLSYNGLSLGRASVTQSLSHGGSIMLTTLPPQHFRHKSKKLV